MVGIAPKKSFRARSSDQKNRDTSFAQATTFPTYLPLPNLPWAHEVAVHGLYAG